MTITVRLPARLPQMEEGGETLKKIRLVIVGQIRFLRNHKNGQFQPRVQLQPQQRLQQPLQQLLQPQRNVLFTQLAEVIEVGQLTADAIQTRKEFKIAYPDFLTNFDIFRKFLFLPDFPYLLLVN